MSLAPYLVSGKPFVFEKTLYKPEKDEVYEVIAFPTKQLDNGAWPYRVVKRTAADFKSVEQFDKLLQEHKLCFYIKSMSVIMMQESVMKPLPCSNTTILYKGNNVGQLVGCPIGRANEVQYQNVANQFKKLFGLKPASQAKTDSNETAALSALSPNLQAEKKEQAAKPIGPTIVSAKA